MSVVVACCFADGQLPSSWFRLYQRLKVAVKRARVDAEVRLMALGFVTDEAAVIVVPPALEPPALARHRGRRVVALAERDAPALNSLVASLSSMGAGAVPEGTPLAHHRGFRLIATRVAGDGPAA